MSGVPTLRAIQLAYGVPSLTLMVFVFWLLSCNKSFKYSFYGLVRIDLSLNIVYYVNSWIALRMSPDPVAFGEPLLLVMESNLPGSIVFSSMLNSCLSYMQNFMTILLALHRLTSSIWLKSDQFWSKYNFVAAFAIIGLSVAIMMPWFLNPHVLAGIKDGHVFTKLDMEKTITFVAIGTFIQFSDFCVILVLGIWTCVAISRSIGKIDSHTASDFRRKLTQLTIVNSFLYSGNLSFGIFVTVSAVLKVYHPILDHAADISSCATDLTTLAMPFVLLFFDRNLRNCVWPFCFVADNENRVFNQRKATSSFIHTTI